MTDEGELRELIDQWRELARISAADPYVQGVNDATESCANELERMLDE